MNQQHRKMNKRLINLKRDNNCDDCVTKLKGQFFNCIPESLRKINIVYRKLYIYLFVSVNAEAQVVFCGTRHKFYQPNKTLRF